MKNLKTIQKNRSFEISQPIHMWCKGNKTRTVSKDDEVFFEKAKTKDYNEALFHIRKVHNEQVCYWASVLYPHYAKSSDRGARVNCSGKVKKKIKI